MSPRGVPGRPHRSCAACLAWGQGFNNGLCKPCWEFARRWDTAECGACGRLLPVKKGHCRLCWCQARLDRSAAHGGATATHDFLLPDVRRVRHHQLFFARIPAPRDLVPAQRAHRRAQRNAREQALPSGIRRPDSAWTQLSLLERAPRAYAFGKVDLRVDELPDNPWLHWAMHHARQLAEIRGWDPVTLATCNRALIVLLAEHHDGDTIHVDDLTAVLRSRGTSVERVAEILTAIGLLHGQRPPAFHRWLERTLHGLAPGIRTGVEQWARLLHDGGPRSRARQANSVRNYVRCLRPLLIDWSRRYTHLREVTDHDITTAMAALNGEHRQSSISALRSLFRWAKKNGVVFRDPSRRLKQTKLPRAIPQPLTTAEIARSVRAAASPHARVAIVLAAVHAARHSDIVNLQLSDVDLADHRLRIAGHQRPLDELTHRALTEWLTYRHHRWPHTANAHLLLSNASALRLGPASLPWINRLLRGQPATLERLRIDRHLDEALASGGDPLQVAEVFGLSDTTAVRYATAARYLLHSGAETPERDHDELPGTLALKSSEPPSGSP